MINPVPPMASEELLPKIPLNVKTTGRAAIKARAIAPMHVTRLTTFLTYLSVSLPGRTPGIYEPFLRKFSASFSGSI